MTNRCGEGRGDRQGGRNVPDTRFEGKRGASPLRINNCRVLSKEIRFGWAWFLTNLKT